MKTGKVMDSNGIASEYFKLATEEIIPTIVKIVNKIFMDKDITKNMKTGIFTCTDMSLYIFLSKVHKSPVIPS
jgi:hypothetical protein